METSPLSFANFEISLQGRVGVFSVKNMKVTFGQMMPQIATFFKQEPDSIFLKNQKDEIIMNSAVVFYTLFPFKYSQISKSMPRLYLTFKFDRNELKESVPHVVIQQKIIEKQKEDKKV